MYFLQPSILYNHEIYSQETGGFLAVIPGIGLITTAHHYNPSKLYKYNYIYIHIAI